MRDVSEELVSIYEAALPPSQPPGLIPRVIHQTYFTSELPPTLADNVGALRAANPAWTHRFYDDKAIEDFVLDTYGRFIFNAFKRIAPSYGVVRADLFRYLVVYALGGVYLDIKSGFDGPIENKLTLDECYIVSHWDNAEGERHEQWGMHPELSDLTMGEIQQWHVIAAPGHPFLRRAIASILARIQIYRPWHDGVGWLGVIALSGPLAYTKAIIPLLPHHPHTQVRDHRQLGLVYSIMPQREHQMLFSSHYVENHRPIVKTPFYLEPFSQFYAAARRWNRQRVGKRVSER